MFGYLRTRTSELRLREFDCYRALYCGLCRQMGKCTGQCSRFSLYYDFVLLAAVRIALAGEHPKTETFRCALHPFKRRHAITGSKTLADCADASVLLSYRKAQDDRHDERGWKKFRGTVACLLLSGAHRKAAKRHPALDRTMKEELEALNRYEKTPDIPPSADIPAEFSARMSEAVLTEGLTGTEARIAAGFGRAIGHWLFLADAADDLAEDRREHRFNPLLSLFGETPSDTDWEDLRMAMTGKLAEAEQAFLLIDRYPSPEYREIIANILYLGLPDTIERILKKQRSQTTADDKGDRQ